MNPQRPEGNRLAQASSPYLLQHAQNPVDWYPWGDEALARARAEDRLLLVSIGYSACHWCHVMAHESFEDPEIARLMNELFVCIKVDREERPDVDDVCMSALHVMGVPGGWPLNVFLTPDLKPFFGGTYFPPSPRYGRIGWPDLLLRVAELWRERRDDVLAQSRELSSALAELAQFAPAQELPEAELFEEASRQLQHRFDAGHGGFGSAPKFPPHEALAFLLRRHVRSGAPRELEIVTQTLEQMASGGIYDHLAGGFHRYSVDEKWLVPHFEKMLYDNAQLARIYIEAFQLTGESEFARVARETLDALLHTMTDSGGAFWSATDADSEGREGAYFVWTRTQIDRVLGEDAALFRRAYGVTEQGNFQDPHHPRRPTDEGENVLHRAIGAAQLAEEFRLPTQEAEARLAAARRSLLEARGRREPPGLDDKIVTSWCGLAVAAMALGGRVFEEKHYVDAAIRAARFLDETMRRPEDGRLLRSWRKGRASGIAFLEDYAFFAEGAIELYVATFDPAHLGLAQRLVDQMNEFHADDEAGGWFHSAIDAPWFVTRGKSPVDSSTPSANAVAARVCLRLAKYLGDGALRERAERALLVFGEAMRNSPGATLGLLGALDLLLHDDGEIALVGDLQSSATQQLFRPVVRAYLPGTALAHRPVSTDPSRGEAVPSTDAYRGETVPWLRDKVAVAGRGTIYMCEGSVCSAPLGEVDDLVRELQRRWPRSGPQK